MHLCVYCLIRLEKCNTVIHDGYYSNSSLNKQNHNVIEEGLLYVMVLWMMAQEAYNYSAQATPCLSRSPECHKSIRFTLLFSHFTRRSSIGLPSDCLIKIWSAFLIPTCLPRVLCISSHLWFSHPNNICRKWCFSFIFFHNPLTASALVSDNLKVPLSCVVPILMACLKAQTCSHG